MVTEFARPRSRAVGVGATVLVHAALILAWQMARSVPPQPAGEAAAFVWVRVPAVVPRPSLTAPKVVPAAPRSAPARPSMATPTVAEPVAAAAPDMDAPAMPNAAAIMDSARRSIGEIDRALRKERQATIVLPPDSPQIRLRRGIEHAHDMAPPRLWEAPKVVELVNNTGDGARRTRVITAGGTYCITERSPVTSIDMIEKHGKQRFTSCPKDEEPAKRQEWRTARD